MKRKKGKQSGTGWAERGDMTDTGLVRTGGEGVTGNAGMRAQAEMCGGELQKGRERRGRSIWATVMGGGN